MPMASTLQPIDVHFWPTPNGRKITIALAETIRLMNEIDETIEEHGGFPIAGSQK